MTNPMGMEYLPTLRMIGPSKLTILRTYTPLRHTGSNPSIGGSKILRVHFGLKCMVNVGEYSIHRTSGFFFQFLNRVTLF